MRVLRAREAAGPVQLFHPGLSMRVLPIILLASLAGCRFEADPRDALGRQLLRLGYFPNVTHSPALYGLESGAFERALGPKVAIRARAFGSGPSVVEAMFAGELDVAYLGPNPAINAYQRSRGQAVRVISGCTFGGAQLVVHPRFGSAGALRGQRLASPALGNTQDVALRRWLAENGIEGAEVLPLAPPDIFTLFQRGELAGAWVPEPWASRLVLEAGAQVLVDERELWPEGRFPTAVLLASTVSLKKRPELIRHFLLAHEEAIAAVSAPEARQVVSQALAKALGKPLPPAVLERAFGQLSFSPALPVQLPKLAEDAHRLGFLKSPDVLGAVEPLAAGAAP
ncbi:MAG: ABC transporter substrate-binding protein [Myxococcales bacterium]|nr:ABC transporter substrate-binding protein [Myxococcales bacterium]